MVGACRAHPRPKSLSLATRGPSRGRERTNINIATSSGPILQFRNLGEQIIRAISQIPVLVAVGHNANRLKSRLPICGIADRRPKRKLVAVFRKGLQRAFYMHQISFNPSVTITHTYPRKRIVHNTAATAALAHKIQLEVKREPCPVPPTGHGPNTGINCSREPTTQPYGTLTSQFRARQMSGSG